MIADAFAKRRPPCRPTDFVSAEALERRLTGESASAPVAPRPQERREVAT